MGFNKEADQIIKFAQQAEQEAEITPPAPAAPEQAAAPAAPATEQAVPEDTTPKGNRSNIDVPTSDKVEPARFEDIETPGPKSGEYDNIIPGEVSITDASKKLEDVASMLAGQKNYQILSRI